MPAAPGCAKEGRRGWQGCRTLCATRGSLRWSPSPCALRLLRGAASPPQTPAAHAHPSSSPRHGPPCHADLGASCSAVNPRCAACTACTAGLPARTWRTCSGTCLTWWRRSTRGTASRGTSPWCGWSGRCRCTSASPCTPLRVSWGLGTQGGGTKARPANGAGRLHDQAAWTVTGCKAVQCGPACPAFACIRAPLLPGGFHCCEIVTARPSCDTRCTHAGQARRCVLPEVACCPPRCACRRGGGDGDPRRHEPHPLRVRGVPAGPPQQQRQPRWRRQQVSAAPPATAAQGCCWQVGWRAGRVPIAGPCRMPVAE